MPFAEQDILNWVQHDAVSGVCVLCGATLHPQAHGIVWTRADLMTRVEPLTNWTVC